MQVPLFGGLSSIILCKKKRNIANGGIERNIGSLLFSDLHHLNISFERKTAIIKKHIIRDTRSLFKIIS